MAVLLIVDASCNLSSVEGFIRNWGAANVLILDNGGAESISSIDGLARYDLDVFLEYDAYGARSRLLAFVDNLITSLPGVRSADTNNTVRDYFVGGSPVAELSNVVKYPSLISILIATSSAEIKLHANVEDIFYLGSCPYLSLFKINRAERFFTRFFFNLAKTFFSYFHQIIYVFRAFLCSKFTRSLINSNSCLEISRKNFANFSYIDLNELFLEKNQVKSYLDLKIKSHDFRFIDGFGSANYFKKTLFFLFQSSCRRNLNISLPESYFYLKDFLSCWILITRIYFSLFKNLSVIKNAPKEQKILISEILFKMHFSGQVGDFSFKHFCLKNLISNHNFKELRFYCEGMPWEALLVKLSRQQNRQVKCVGYCHSTIRFWDLRYFKFDWEFWSDFRCDEYEVSHIEGYALLQRCRNLSSVKLVPSLRYTSRIAVKVDSEARSNNCKVPLVVGVVGDYDSITTSVLLDWVRCVLDSGMVGDLLIRLHPSAPIKLHRVFRSERVVSGCRLEEIAHRASLIVCGGGSSALVELAEAGVIPVCCRPMQASFPFLALENVSDRVVVRSASELRHVITSVYEGRLSLSTGQARQLFCRSTV